MQMAEDKKDYEKKTKPIMDTLRSYQDLPPVCKLAYFSLYVMKQCSNFKVRFEMDVGICELILFILRAVFVFFYKLNVVFA